MQVGRGLAEIRTERKSNYIKLNDKTLTNRKKLTTEKVENLSFLGFLEAKLSKLCILKCIYICLN